MAIYKSCTSLLCIRASGGSVSHSLWKFSAIDWVAVWAQFSTQHWISLPIHQHTYSLFCEIWQHMSKHLVNKRSWAGCIDCMLCKEGTGTAVAPRAVCFPYVTAFFCSDAVKDFPNVSPWAYVLPVLYFDQAKSDEIKETQSIAQLKL